MRPALFQLSQTRLSSLLTLLYFTTRHIIVFIVFMKYTDDQQSILEFAKKLVHFNVQVGICKIDCTL